MITPYWVFEQLTDSVLCYQQRGCSLYLAVRGEVLHSREKSSRMGACASKQKAAGGGSRVVPAGKDVDQTSIQADSRTVAGKVSYHPFREVEL